ncbi:hypothetical protein [Streptomyces sp. NPDC007991]|uniref:hypothetical protein n=1 Tax=Streptomyces sp. NPDC007991 TaxID=3364803 RepID=UPI0036E38128
MSSLTGKDGELGPARPDKEGRLAVDLGWGIRQAAGAWYRQTYRAVTDSADPKNPGRSPSQQISAAIAGRQSVDKALENSQDLARAAAAKYRGE